MGLIIHVTICMGYGFFFVLLFNIFVTNRISALRSYSARPFLSICKMFSFFFLFYHRCGRYFMYERIGLFCLILERMEVKTGYAEHATNIGHTYCVQNRKYCNYTGYQCLYSKDSIYQIEKWEKNFNH